MLFPHTDGVKGFIVASDDPRRLELKFRLKAEVHSKWTGSDFSRLSADLSYETAN